MQAVADRLPMTAKEISRYIARVALFKRRGWAEDKADQWADRLALRDQQRDDRRACIECAHLQRGGTCFAASQGWMPGVDKRLQPITDLLQRCERFSWQKP